MALFNWPMPQSAYRVTQGFGGDHRGIDMAAPLKTPFYAAADGTVVAAGPASGFGQWIVIDHQVLYSIKDHPLQSGWSTVYGHMYPGDIFVRPGQAVRQGDKIGLVGSNGESTGPHLHFELWAGKRLAGGTAVDPATAGLGPTGDPNTLGLDYGNPLESVARDVVNISDAIGAIVDLIKFLTDPKNWVRVGLSALGAILLLIGLWSLYKYGKGRV